MTEEIRELFARLEAWWNSQCPLPSLVPLYSIGTWDTDQQAYTPQIGVPAFNLTLHQLRRSMRMLVQCGYLCHRRRDADGTHDDNDTDVLIERTDGKSEADIMEAWKR